MHLIEQVGEVSINISADDQIKESILEGMLFRSDVRKKIVR